MLSPVSSSSPKAPDEPEKNKSPIIALFREYIRPLQEQLKQIYENRIKPLTDRIAKLEFLNWKLQTEVDEAGRELQKVQFEAARKLQALNTQIQGLEQRLGAEVSKNDQQAGQIAELQSQLAQLRTEYQALNQRFLQQEADLQQANLQINDLDSRVQGLALRVVELEERLRAEQAGRAAEVLQARQARLSELQAHSALTNEKLHASSLEMGMSFLPLAGAYLVGGPVAWVTGALLTVAGYYNAWSRREENPEATKSRQEEIARLSAALNQKA
jgi:DNA repair exonuclease SbcCD ATPase subunit